MASARVKGTRKIRAYPKDEEFLIGLIRQQRRAYNLAIACFKEADAGLIGYDDPDLRKTDLRRIIRDFVAAEYVERKETFVSAWCDEAVNDAFTTRQAVIRKRMKG